MTSQSTLEQLKQRVSELEAEIAAMKSSQSLPRAPGQNYSGPASTAAGQCSSEQYYRLIIENAADLIFTVNEQGDFSYISPNCRFILGYSPETYIGENFVSFVHPDDVSSIINTLSDIFVQYKSSGASAVRRVILDFRVLSGSGYWIWLSAGNTLVKEAGRHIEVVCIARDVTGQKHAAKKLEESEQRYRFMVEESSDIIWTFDLSAMEFSYVSKSVEPLLGFSAKEVTNLGLDNAFSPKVRKQVMKAFGQVIAEKSGDSRVMMEAEHLHKDRSAVLMEVNAVLHRDASGKPKFFTGISRDITQRKRSEEALRRSEEKYRTILETIEDGYFEVDLAGNFVFYNSAMCRMLGYGADELMGLNYRAYMSPQQKEEAFETYNRVFRTGKPYKAVNWELVRKDGGICHVETSISLVRNSEGKAAGFQGIAHDATQRRLAQKENEKLQARLHHARQMEAMGRLAGGIAHDFNNILTSVLGYTELSLDEVERGSLVHHNLSQVMTAGARAKNLVKQILAVSRREKESFRPVTIIALIRETLQRVGSTIPDSIELREQISGEDLIVNGDPVQLDQMLVNLINNAVHAMEGKGGVLVVAAGLFSPGDEDVKGRHPDAVAGDYVRISVSDTGEGISEEFLDKIFEPYFTSRKEGTGTGLGLSIVDGIIRSHRGYLRVESRPGSGSTFYVHLPLDKTGTIPES